MRDLRTGVRGCILALWLGWSVGSPNCLAENRFNLEASGLINVSTGVGDVRSSPFGPVGIDVAYNVAEVDFSAHALANYGSVGAAVSFLDGNFDRSISPEPLVVSQATALDTLTILGGTGRGTATLTFDLDGSAFSNASAYLGGYFQFRAWYIEPDTGDSLDLLRLVVVNDVGYPTGRFVAAPIEFEYGTPFLFGMSIRAEFLQHEHGPSTGVPVAAQIDYLHTASWSGATVVDADGSPNIGFSISSASGTDYPIAAAAVPEPSTLAMSSLGAAALVGLGLHRRRRSG